MTYLISQLSKTGKKWAGESGSVDHREDYGLLVLVDLNCLDYTIFITNN